MVCVMLAVTVMSSSTQRTSLTILPDVLYPVLKYDCVSMLEEDGAGATTAAAAEKLALLAVTAANTAPGTYVSELASVTPSL